MQQPSRIFLPILFLLIALFGLSGVFETGKFEERLPQQVSFNFHIRPILSDRCFACHGPDEKKREAGLRLDTREGALAALGEKKDHYAIVPGHPEKSTLLSRINTAVPDSVMPPPSTHLTLSERERQLLERWIKQGAAWDKHWALIVPQKPALPKVKRKNWPENPIDYFTLSEMEARGFSPSPEAEKWQLLRRVSFDLTGLPPSPEMIDRFIADDSPEAYEKIVDELLRSSDYGERMTMTWLDLARYSDTHGYQDDLPRIMWPWRDWVIKAFNENMPYDRFVTWQLAGDLLPNATKEQMLAGAFNRNHKISQEGGIIDEEYRVEYVADRTNTFGKAFLGMTMECSRCHDHKYDPFTTEDYYSLFAFFNKVPENGFVLNLEIPKPFMPITKKDVDVNGVLAFLNTCEVIQSEKDTIRQMVMKDDSTGGGRKTFVLNRGQYDQPTRQVTEKTPASILPFDQKLPRNRLGLAQWLFDKGNPLTARVMVNRLWQEMFGRGIAPTTDNLGMQGALPTHPALLDWLAVDFRDNGWDIKRTLKLMVTSATYKQSSSITAVLAERDPENKWLARGPRYRMPYEFIRDNILTSSGLLVQELGGPSVKPYQPPGLWEAIASDPSADNYRGEGSYVADTLPYKMYRRSVYTYNRRTIPPPAHLIFDAPIRDNCEVSRARTSTPLQALALLNDPQVQEAARVLAAQLLGDKKAGSPEQRMISAFRRILSRQPNSKELNAMLNFVAIQQQAFSKDPKRAEAMLAVGRYPNPRDLDKTAHASWMMAMMTIYNLAEMVEKG